MDAREFVINSISRVRQGTLRTVQGLSQLDLRWQPAAFANPVGFLLFHIFRTEDRYFYRWLGTPDEVWERQRWSQRWKLPEPHSDAPEAWYSQTGNSWTPEQVAGWEPPPKEELLDYGKRVRENILRTLQGFDLGKLKLAPDQDRPNWTYADYLHLISHHEAQHQGQMDYVVGLMRGQMGV